MKSTVYIETTIVSYLTARPATDPAVTGHIADTQAWWKQSRNDYELVTSEVVLTEAAGGDPDAAKARLKELAAITLVPVSDAAKTLAFALLSGHALPAKAYIDALHLATAASNGIEYLLTWNCRHLANATLRGRIEQACADQGFRAPVICTPLELNEVSP